METILATYFAWVVALVYVPVCLGTLAMGILHNRPYSCGAIDFITAAAVTCLLCLYDLFPVMP